MLRSDTLMLDNKLCPLYQETLAALTFTAEHNNEQFCSEDDEDEQSLLMTGTERRARKHE